MDVKKRRRRFIGLIAAVCVLLSGVTGLTAYKQVNAKTLKMNPEFAVNGFRRVIDDQHPVLTFTMVMGHNTENDSDFRRDINYRGQDIKQMWEAIPEDIRPYCVLTLHFGSVYNKWNTKADARKWVEDNLMQGQSLGIPMMLIYGGNRSQAMAGSQEDTFQWIQSLYDSYDNFIGTTSSEQTDADVTAAVPGLVKMAAGNGGYHIHANQETINQFYSKIVANKANGDILRQYHDHFIYTPKNVHCNYDYNFSEAYGMWLADMSAGFGTYVDSYNWYQNATTGGKTKFGTNYSDYVTRAFPESAYAINMIENALNGAIVFQYENQMDIPATNSMYSPLFWNSMVPAMRTIINNIDIPTKEECIAKSKVGFYEDKDQTGLPADCGGRGSYNGSGMLNVGSDGESTTFYEGLYDGGIDMYNNGNSNLRYFFRTSGRYGIIPQIPIHTPESTLNSLKDAGMTIIDCDYYLENFKSVQDKIDFFNEKYEEINTGNATVNNNKNSWQIYNNAVNEDRVQSAQVPLTDEGSFSAIDFKDISTHSSATVTDNGDELVIDLNNYRTDRGAEGDLVARDSGKRILDILDYYNEFKYCTDPSDDELRETKMIVYTNTNKKPQLEIGGYDRNNYTYEESWDEAGKKYTITVKHNGPVNIVLNAKDSAWTKVEQSDIKKSGSRREVKFFGTSVEWKGEGNADISVDGVKTATGVSEYHQTGLSNTYHTITADGADGEFQYIEAYVQMLTDSYLQDFAYGTREEDQDYFVDSEHWTVTEEDTYEANDPVKFKGKEYQTYNKTGKTDNGVMKILPYVAPFWSDMPVYMAGKSYTDASFEADFNTSGGTPVSFALRTDITYKRGYYITVNPLRLSPTNAGTNQKTLAVLDGTSCKATADPDLRKNTWYTIKIDVQGTEVSVYIKERGSADYEAPVLTYSGIPSKEGYFGIRAEHNSGKETGEGIGNAVSVQGKGLMNDFIYMDNVKITDHKDGSRNYSCDFENDESAKDWKGEGAVLFDSRQPETGFGYADQWQNSGGSWKVVNDDNVWANGDNGVYVGEAEAGKENYSWSGSAEWNNYLYNSLLKFDKSGGKAGVLFRIQDENNMYKLSVARNGDNAALQFMKKQNGSWETIGEEKTVIMKNGVWYAFNLTVSDDIFTLSLDDKKLMEAEDSTFSSGRTGFAVSDGTKAYFDNAWVSVLHTEKFKKSRGKSTDAGSPMPAAGGKSDPVIVSLDTSYITTERMKVPELPEKVRAVLSDGSTKEVEVNWETKSPEDFKDAVGPMYNWTGGKEEVYGTVEGSEVKAAADITVIPVPNLKTSTVSPGRGSEEPLDTEILDNSDEPQEVAYGETINLPRMHYLKMTYECGNGVTFTDPYSYVWWDKAGMEVTKEDYQPGDLIKVTGHVGKYNNLIYTYYKVIEEREEEKAAYEAVPAEGGTVEGPASIPAGKEKDIKATANEGYQFGCWTIRDNKTGETTTVERTKNILTTTGIAEGDRTYIAHFVKELSSEKKEIQSVNGSFDYLYPYAQVKLTVTGGNAGDYSWSVEGASGTANDAGMEGKTPGQNSAQTNISQNGILSLTSDEEGTLTVTATPKDGTSGLEVLTRDIHVKKDGEAKLIDDNDASANIKYSPSVGSSTWAPWTGGNQYNRYNKTEHKWNNAVSDKDSYARLNFEGTGIQVITESGTGQGGNAEVYVDNIYQGTYTITEMNGGANMYHYVFFAAEGLENGPHTVDIVPVAAAGKYRIPLDGFIVTKADKQEEEFETIHTKIVPEGAGSITAPDKITAGETKDLTAEAEEGYRFAYWTITDEATGKTETVERSRELLPVTGTAGGIKTYTAHFNKTDTAGERVIQPINGELHFLYPHSQTALTVANGSADEYTWSVSGDTGVNSDAGGPGCAPAANGRKTNISDDGILSLSSDAVGSITVKAEPKDASGDLKALTRKFTVEESDKVKLIDDYEEDVISYSPEVGRGAWEKWNGGTIYSRYNKTEHKWNSETTDSNSYARMTFEGTGIQVITDSGSGSGGAADVYIDNEYQGTYDVFRTNGGAQMSHYVFFAAEGLEKGKHVIDVVPRAEKGKYRVTLDGFVVTAAGQEDVVPPEIGGLQPEKDEKEVKSFDRFKDVVLTSHKEGSSYELKIPVSGAGDFNYRLEGENVTPEEGSSEIRDGFAVLTLERGFSGTVTITAENSTGTSQKILRIYHETEAPKASAELAAQTPVARSGASGRSRSLKITAEDNGGIQRLSYIIQKNGKDQPEKVLFEEAADSIELPGLSKDLSGTKKSFLDAFDVYEKMGTELTLDESGTYRVTVRAFDYFGNMSEADTEEFTVEGKTVVHPVNIEMKGGKYNKKPYAFRLTQGSAVQWEAMDGTDAAIEEDQIKVLYQGREGTEYEDNKAPVNAGKYTLILSVDGENPDYTGSESLEFEISRATVTVTALDKMVRAGEGPVSLSKPSEKTDYKTAGLCKGDSLNGKLTLTYTDKDGKHVVPDWSRKGEYQIVPSGLKGGNNYKVAYVNGNLTIEAAKVQAADTLDEHKGGKTEVNRTGSGQGGAKTGDTSTAGIYLGIMGLCAAFISGICLNRRKLRREV